MTLPSSGTISMSQVNTELGYSSSAAVSLNQADVRTLAGKASGAISLSDLYGKSAGVSLIQKSTPIRMTSGAPQNSVALDPAVQEGDLLIIQGGTTGVFRSGVDGVSVTTLWSYSISKTAFQISHRKINNLDVALGAVYVCNYDTTASGSTIRILVFRPAQPYTTLNTGTWTGSASLNGSTAPASYTISASGQSTPLILVGATDDSAPPTNQDNLTASPADFDYISADATFGQIGYKIYNSGTPANHTMTRSNSGNAVTQTHGGGFISFNNVASGKTAGVKIFNTPGTWSFTVPDYASTFIIKINGAGGGGGANTTNSGSAGSATTCTNLGWTAGGGGGGLPNAGNGGAGGTNSGTADTSSSGAAGSKGTSTTGGAGAPSAMDPNLGNTTATAGSPGGSGGQGGRASGNGGSGGGSGGFMKKTYSAGGIAVGTVLTGTIGTGGTGGTAGGAAGQNGQNGAVYIEWY